MEKVPLKTGNALEILPKIHIAVRMIITGVVYYHIHLYEFYHTG